MEPKESNIFKFKQFQLSNRLSAMKINTDGVVLGAWCSLHEGDFVVWDVGCGTGVIALMIAQRCGAKIYAIDIDDKAIAETAMNIASSPWPDRVVSVHGDVSLVKGALPAPDLIVSNPPYFSEKIHSLVSPKMRRATARHEGTLSYDVLIELASDALSPGGRLAIISPFDREDDIMMSAAMNRMDIHRKLFLKSSEKKRCKRILWELGRDVDMMTEETLVIRRSDGRYTPEFWQLVKDFYL